MDTQEALRLHAAVRVGDGDSRRVDLFGVIGSAQTGRVRYSGKSQRSDKYILFQSIDATLRARRRGELFDYLPERLAAHSDISGVQPTVMIRVCGKAPDLIERPSPSAVRATYIV